MSGTGPPGQAAGGRNRPAVPTLSLSDLRAIPGRNQRRTDVALFDDMLKGAGGSGLVSQVHRLSPPLALAASIAAMTRSAKSPLVFWKARTASVTSSSLARMLP